MSSRDRAADRLTRRTVVLLGVAAGLLALLTTLPVWVRATTSSALSAVVPVAAPGTDAAPAATAGALVVVAAALALTLAGRVGSRVVGVVLLLAGVVVTGSAVSVLSDPGPAASSADAEALGVGLLDEAATATVWPAVTAVLGLFVLLLGVAALRQAGRWRRDGRHEGRGTATPGPREVLPGEPASDVSGPAPSTSGTADAGSDQESWDALSRGEDPT